MMVTSNIDEVGLLAFYMYKENRMERGVSMWRLSRVSMDCAKRFCNVIVHRNEN